MREQRIAPGILTQPRRYKRAESNLLADEKGSQQGDPGSSSCIVNSYTSIFIHVFSYLLSITFSFLVLEI